MFSFRAQPKKIVIASVSVAISWKRNDKLFCARAAIINYSLLIINFYATAARVLSSKQFNARDDDNNHHHSHRRNRSRHRRSDNRNLRRHNHHHRSRRGYARVTS